MRLKPRKVLLGVCCIENNGIIEIICPFHGKSHNTCKYVGSTIFNSLFLLYMLSAHHFIGLSEALKIAVISL